MAGPRGEYRKSAERRAQIIDAAFGVFSRDGYTAGSVNEIARVVGISQTGVLHHFAGGKPALLQAVLEQRDARAEVLLADRTGREFLAGLVEISSSQESRRGLVQLYRRLAAEAVDATHPAHDYVATRFRRIVDAVTDAFAEVADQGGLRPGLDPRDAALQAVAMTEGQELLWLHGFEIDLAAHTKAFLDTLLVEPL